MQVHIRAFCERAADGKPGAAIPFVAATSDVARDGLVIETSAWQLGNYQRSPVVLWSHDYMGARPPIGRAENVRVEGGHLKADIVFDQGDPFAVDIERKFREGFLNAVSVGWETVEMAIGNDNAPPRVTRAELLDISAVNVPGDPGALMERQKRALALQAHDILRIVEPEPDPSLQADAAAAGDPPARASWDESAAAMARLFRPYAQRPDAERQPEWRKVARDYARLGRTPPEFLPQDALDALSAAEIRGLFLEGEPESHAAVFAAMETRAGAVLSQRNLDDLTQIAALASGIIERASKDTQKNGQADAERASQDALEQLHALMTKGTI